MSTLPTVDDPSRLLVAVRVREPIDPAFNPKHPKYQELVRAYDASRSPAALAALMECVHPDQKPVRFHLSAIDVNGVMFATEGTDPAGFARYLRAFEVSCFEVEDDEAEGGRIVADMLSRGETPQATREHSNRMVKRYGANAIREMGALALRRAEVTARTADPYARLFGAPPLRL